MSEEKEPLLEGALFNAELAGGGRVNALPSQTGEGRVNAPSFQIHEPAAGLDLLVSMDEPMSLMKRLKEIADEHPKTDKRWVGVSRLCERYAEYAEVINRPEANRPHGSVLGGSHGKAGVE